MLKVGRKAIKGHRMELLIMELWICLCWLLPIVIELVVCRVVPSAPVWKTAVLLGGYFLNRLLLAPAHTGYYACCRRLASSASKKAQTCEIEDLREEYLAPTLLRCFFLDYTHPLASLKWQLKWDALRLGSCAVLLFPSFLFIAVGAGEETPLLQAVCGAGGVLFGVAGLLFLWLILCRLRPMLYYRPQYAPFTKQLLFALSKSRKRLGQATLSYVKAMRLPVVFVPFLSLRAAFFVEQAKLFSAPPIQKTRKQRLRIFHTRVLRET